VDEGKNELAVSVIEKGFDLVPASIVPYEYFSLEMLNTFYKSGAKEKASAIGEKAYKSFNDLLAYLISLPAEYRVSGDVSEEIQRTLFYLQKLENSCAGYGDKALADKSGKAWREYLSRYQGK
jgi:hypothetical protein